MMLRAAIIVAGGTGTRMGGGMPKQFLPLAGKPVMVRTLERFLRHDAAMPIVVVMHEGAIARWDVLCQEWFSATDRARVRTCAGGQERSDSVHNGLNTLAGLLPPKAPALVAIHDAVRPFVTEAMLAQAFGAAEQRGSAICCVPVKTSLRISLGDGSSQAVDRTRYWEVQTPQIFDFAALVDVYVRRPHNAFTDDASLYEAFGHSVHLCAGSYDNIKLTTPEDMFVGERILARFGE